MDVDTAGFEREVIEASRTLPVVVDFWATWCGPCRTLGPVIDKVARDYAGRVKLVKVDSDRNAELANAYGVRSIPNVIAFKDGRPVAQFLGAVPESQVRAFFEQLLPSPAEEALRRAEALFAEEQYDEAERELAAVTPDPTWDARVEALRRGIAFARMGEEGPSEDELKARLAADAADHDARLALAGVYASRQRYREAMDQLLEVVRRARDYRDGEARKQLLAIFDLAAEQRALVSEYRRKLASTLH